MVVPAVPLSQVQLDLVAVRRAEFAQVALQHDLIAGHLLDKGSTALLRLLAARMMAANLALH